MNRIGDFGNTAKSLARNPLGIIALFIVLVYGFASLVVIFSANLEGQERIPIIWFLVLFPVAVLGVFSWLVSEHHNKLYAPSDYRDEKNFLTAHIRDLKKLPIAAKEPVDDSELNPNEESFDLPAGRSKHRDEMYGLNRGYFLVHSYTPSDRHGQDFDIFIYLIRHKSDDQSDVQNAEFFFGRYWGNKIFEGEKIGDIIGVRTSAYGPFLCTCRITFDDGEQVMLDRYIDFEMAVTHDEG